MKKTIEEVICKMDKNLRRRRMRKKISALILSGIFVVMSVLLTGCINSSDELSYESDGQFHYYDCGDSYIIIGAEEELPETVYVPSHYKGKEIVSYNTTYTPPSTIGDGHERYYWLYLDNVKRVYFPYNCDRTYFDWTEKVGSKSLTEQFYTSNGFDLTDFIDRADDVYFLSKMEVVSGSFFVRSTMYEKCVSEIPEFMKDKYHAKFFTFQEGKHRLTMRQEYRKDHEYVGHFEFQIQVANTSYLFNYEGSPNDGYFFINDFEYGKKIENTPYEPMREGYTFGGWYKEAECKNEWNFDEDKLPEARYDEDGNVEFVETKLYAKWIKN